MLEVVGGAHFKPRTAGIESRGTQTSKSSQKSAVRPPLSIKIKAARYSRALEGRFYIRLNNGFDFLLSPSCFPELDEFSSHVFVGVGATEAGDAIEIAEIGFNLGLEALVTRFLGQMIKDQSLSPETSPDVRATTPEMAEEV